MSMKIYALAAIGKIPINTFIPDNWYEIILADPLDGTNKIVRIQQCDCKDKSMKIIRLSIIEYLWVMSFIGVELSTDEVKHIADRGFVELNEYIENQGLGYKIQIQENREE